MWTLSGTIHVVNLLIGSANLNTHWGQCFCISINLHLSYDAPWEDCVSVACLIRSKSKYEMDKHTRDMTITFVHDVSRNCLLNHVYKANADKICKGLLNRKRSA